MSKNVTNHKKIVFEWNKPLGNKDKPYAYRWRIDFYYFSLRVHKWICSDDTRAYHSHPVNMFIWIINGSYLDHYIDHYGNKMVEYYHTGKTRIIKRHYRHFVDIIHKPTWTFLFTWGTPKRWAFWDKLTLKKRNRDKYFIEEGQHICE